MSFIEKAKKKLGELTGSNDGNVSNASDVAGQSTVDKVKSEQGIFDKIQNFFTGGYGTKEDLRELDNVIMTPHIGSSTTQACNRMAKSCLKNISFAHSGKFDSMNIISL